MKILYSRFSMICMGRYFRDTVSGEWVYAYMDKYGVWWMANKPFKIWGFRIKMKDTNKTNTVKA